MSAPARSQGSTGMGLATAKRFVEEGMDYVFITGRRKDVLDRAVRSGDTARTSADATCDCKM